VLRTLRPYIHLTQKTYTPRAKTHLFVNALAAWRAAVGGGEAMSEAKPGRQRRRSRNAQMITCGKYFFRESLVIWKKGLKTIKLFIT
jgi:hypothetical protein